MLIDQLEYTPKCGLPIETVIISYPYTMQELHFVEYMIETAPILAHHPHEVEKPVPL